MSHLNQFVQQCHDNLIHGKSGEIEACRDYISKRHINKESIDLHKIGYCSYGDSIPEEINFFGKSKQDINVNGKGGYAYFIRGRMIVPIYSEFGLIVGFATRKPSFEPGNTWWNLSKPFQKSHHLFLLDKARKTIFQNDKIFLVEGYIDAIILYQEGIREVVGLMGTNLSSRQVGLISRYCSNICLCLDVDQNQSGQKAQGKAIHALKRFDFYDAISAIQGLPVGEDPDVFVAKNGLPALLNLEKQMTPSEIMKIYKSVVASNRGKL